MTFDKRDIKKKRMHKLQYESKWVSGVAQLCQGKSLGPQSQGCRVQASRCHSKSSSQNSTVQNDVPLVYPKKYF